MNDSLTVLWVLGLGLYAGLKLRDWWERQPAPRHAQVEQRTTQALCNCEECRPPYWQAQPNTMQ